MDNLSKRILELASEDQKFYESFTHAPDLGVAAALLKEKGVEASAEELEAALKPEEVTELSDDELEAVAGGKACGCVLGGGGESSGNADAVCACVAAGVGYETNDVGGGCRCYCPAVGGGTSHN